MGRQGICHYTCVTWDYSKDNFNFNHSGGSGSQTQGPIHSRLSLCHLHPEHLYVSFSISTHTVGRQDLPYIAQVCFEHVIPLLLPPQCRIMGMRHAQPPFLTCFYHCKHLNRWRVWHQAQQPEFHPCDLNSGRRANSPKLSSGFHTCILASMVPHIRSKCNNKAQPNTLKKLDVDLQHFSNFPFLLFH